MGDEQEQTSFLRVFSFIFGSARSLLLSGLFSSCGRGAGLELWVCRLLIAAASLVADPGLWGMRLPQLQLLGSGAHAQWLRLSGLLLLGMWHLPRPDMEPMPAALAGGFFTTEPPGKAGVES